MEQATGKLGVLMPGLGAVSTTIAAGVLLAKDGLGQLVGSLSQLGEVDGRPVGDVVPLAGLDDLAFAAWDPVAANGYEAATEAGVLDARHLDPIRDQLAAIEPMTAVFDQRRVRRLENATNVKTEGTLMDQAEAVIDDIAAFGASCDRLVMVSSMSTESYEEPTAIHRSLSDFERGLKDSDPAIAPSQVYAYAALRSGVPFANGTPNQAADIPALIELAEREGVPVAGKDYKTGQTFMKTALAPALKTRMLGLNGWFSTNILGNRDGQVLADPENFRSKEISKLGVLDGLLEPDKYPDLYGNISHEVRINYYPPRGDQKEGWDSIDVFGWLGYPMQIKVDFLCRDSILAAPIVLDLARFLDVAHRSGLSGVQEWLGFYFKDPQTLPGNSPEHDLFAQRVALDDALLKMAASAG